jgi:hypothetical protein
MKHRTNPRQLVLRRDSATGLTLVGWETDLPVGRFEHIELIGESPENSLPERGSEYYAAYQAALQQARRQNLALLEQQVRHHQARGWYRVPFALADVPEQMVADHFGNYATAAMQLHYQLTQNRKPAWVVILEGTVVHVRARYPRKTLDELTYQVWYHKQLHQLNQVEGNVLEGRLVTCESGLWFEARAES